MFETHQEDLLSKPQFMRRVEVPNQCILKSAHANFDRSRCSSRCPMQIQRSFHSRVAAIEWITELLDPVQANHPPGRRNRAQLSYFRVFGLSRFDCDGTETSAISAMSTRICACLSGRSIATRMDPLARTFFCVGTMKVPGRSGG